MQDLNLRSSAFIANRASFWKSHTWLSSTYVMCWLHLEQIIYKWHVTPHVMNVKILCSGFEARSDAAEAAATAARTADVRRWVWRRVSESQRRSLRLHAAAAAAAVVVDDDADVDQLLRPAIVPGPLGRLQPAPAAPATTAELLCNATEWFVTYKAFNLFLLDVFI